MVINDWLDHGHYVARNLVCRSALLQLGEQIQRFGKRNGGKMPTGLLDPSLDIPRAWMLQCPMSARMTYVFDFTADQRPDRPICWDGQPHVPARIFPWLNKPQRNVLLADGTVRTLPEPEFQALRLTGTRLSLDQVPSRSAKPRL